MASDSGSKAAEFAGGLDFAVGNVDKLTDEVGNAGSFDRSDIHDPQQQLDYKRGKIEAEHQGLRGVVGSIYSVFGRQPSYQQEMDELTAAQQYSAAGDTKYSENSSAQQEHARLQQLRGQLDSAVVSEKRSDFDKQRQSIEQNYLDELQAARSEQLAADQGRLNVLNQSAAGDQTGADRSALENQLDAEESSIDPNDRERLQEFQKTRNQTLANFKAEASRESQLEAAQSNDRILGYGEEAKDATVRAEGKDDEAKVSELNFATEQRVRSLQERADAEGDSTKKAQLQREAAAAADAGKAEREALQQELQRHNTQSPALEAASQAGVGAHDAAGLQPNAEGNLVEVVRKLDETAGKLTKALTHSKRIVILED